MRGYVFALSEGRYAKHAVGCYMKNIYLRKNWKYLPQSMRHGFILMSVKKKKEKKRRSIYYYKKGEKEIARWFQESKCIACYFQESKDVARWFQRIERNFQWWFYK